MFDERHLKAIRFLEGNPKITQREFAKALGISLGGANHCLNSLLEVGWVKLDNFQKSPNKLGYLYLLTPEGIAAKSTLTTAFLKQKLKEYEALAGEIEELQNELGGEYLTRERF